MATLGGYGVKTLRVPAISVLMFDKNNKDSIQI
jgi:hypothetical protein